MGFLQLLVVAVLASEHRVAGAAEVFGNSSEGLIEFSVGKFRYFELNRPFPEEAILHDISSNVTFLIFQIHSQYQNTTVSFSPIWNRTCTLDQLSNLCFGRLPIHDNVSSGLQTLLSNSSETGTASGLVFILRPEQSTCTWYLGTSGIQPVQNMAILLSYSERDPVPGGCNLEFDLDIDPNIYLEYNFFETTIKFAPANLGYARGVDPPPCDAGTDQDSRWRLQYDVYQYFLPENDLTEEMLLKHLQRMVSVPQVKASALKVVTLTANDKTSVSFSSLPGQGVIYNVIVWDPFLNTSAAYIPAHTYACSFEAGEGSCASLGRVSSKVFFTLFALLGFFICFFGHRFWKTELFFIGFIIMGFFFYILITRLTPIKYDGNLKIFHDDGVFWVTFSCIAILIPVVFMGCLRILNILTCGVIGSYSVVLAIDSYWSTSLSYITLNVLKRALNKDFHRAFTNVPFQTNDFIILAVWGMLAVSGITLQIRRERGRPFFPPHPYKLWKQERERRVTNILDPSYHIPPLRERLYGRLTQIKGLFQKEQPAGERTPLLL
ncbi:transmembrane 7 superfamily member 3 isoform X2 [Homo sapiens]|uniref:transmembrane 7 superfamily member 3 isoform X2 n=1 Tax=Homo sapiens TaxID=9606 RepID=UPI001FB05835|nr:transmembrane 7 superfamily member 3 isoform X2 [Homo sapiens]XP_054228234.1 transmembrane 7 superfamily member 3 isoform X2 [Homo sapiens]